MLYKLGNKERSFSMKHHFTNKQQKFEIINLSPTNKPSISNAFKT